MDSFQEGRVFINDETIKNWMAEIVTLENEIETRKDAITNLRKRINKLVEMFPEAFEPVSITSQTGDMIIDVLEAHPGGLGPTEIYEALGGRLGRSNIAARLALLKRKGKIAAVSRGVYAVNHAPALDTENVEE